MTQSARLSAWYFGYFAFVGAFLPYFSLYLQSIHLSAGRIALLMSLGHVMRLIAPLLWSWMAARGVQRGGTGNSRVRIVIASTALACVSFVVVFLTESFIGLLLGLVVVFFFWSASLPIVEALTLGHLATHPERYGRIRLWGSVGFIVAVLGVGLLLDMAPIGTLLWVSWLLLFGTLISSLGLVDAQASFIRASEPITPVLRQPAVIYLLAAGFFMTAAHGALYVFYSIHLSAQGYSTTVIGTLWTLGVIAEIVVFLYMPALSRRFNLRIILLLSFALAVVRFAAIGWGVALLGVLVFAQLLHAASFGAHHAATMAALNRWFSPGQQAHAQALYGSVAYGAGGLIGALLAGGLWSWIGPELTFSTASLIAFIGLLLVWWGFPDDSADDSERTPVP